MPSHAAELFEALSDPSIYMFLPLDPLESVQAQASRIEDLLPRRDPRGEDLWLNWVVRERKSGRCVGRVEATVPPVGRASIAYLFAPAAGRRGLATEATRAMIRFLVIEGAVQGVEATIDRRNARSIRLVERLGFRLERSVPAADFFKGASSDEVVYGLDATEVRRLWPD